MSLLVLNGAAFRVTALPLRYEQGDDDARALSGALRRTRLYGRKRGFSLTTSLLSTAEADALESAADSGNSMTLDLTSLGRGTFTVVASLEARTPQPGAAGLLETVTLTCTEV